MADLHDKLSQNLLVLRCQTGDEDAYRELVDRFGPRLTYFLRKLVGCPNKADDLAQEVWLDVLRQLPRLNDAGAFTTWLYRIAHGKAMLDGRRQAALPPTSSHVEQLAERLDEPLALEDVARIHVALDRLERPHREVLVLRFMEDLTYEEISRVVGCPVGTVRSRIYYAKTQLRRLLGHG